MILQIFKTHTIFVSWDSNQGNWYSCCRSCPLYKLWHRIKHKLKNNILLTYHHRRRWRGIKRKKEMKNTFSVLKTLNHSQVKVILFEWWDAQSKMFYKTRQHEIKIKYITTNDDHEFKEDESWKNLRINVFWNKPL